MLPGFAGICGFVASAGGGGGTVATLTIASGTVGSNLTDFPVLVDLSDMPAGFWSGVDADGGNIRVKQSGSVIPFDLCMIDTGAETGILMFLASLLSASDNEFTIDLDGNGLLDATDPNGRNAVWADYDIVVGFDGTTTNRTAVSVAVGGSNGTATNFPQFLGFVGFSRTWSGATRRSVYTLGCSYYRTSDPSGASDALVGYQNVAPGTANRQTLAVREGSPDANGVWNPSDGWLQPTANGGTLNTLYRSVMTQNGTTNRKLYLNGALQGTDTGTTAYPLAGSDAMIQVGTSPGGGEAVIGELGYIYVRNGEMSADWIAAENESWHSPATFYSVA